MKYIEIKRHFNLVEMQQEDPEVKAWLGQSFRAIGPYFDPNTKTTAIGLSFEEQRILMPTFLGIEATDKDFRKTVKNHFDEIVTQVPKDGIKLIISLHDDTQPLSESNLPINVKDYVAYRHAKGHPDVAPNHGEAKRIFGKRYYIHDPEGANVEANQINELEDKAVALYMRFKDDVIKTDQILTMLGKDIKNMKASQKVLALKSAAQRDPKLNEVAQRDAFKRFIETVEDKELEYKYLIQEMIGAQYLRRVGNNILYAESGKLIGENLADAVLYFKNPKNSRELNLMKAEYQVKVKKGTDYLPKEDPAISES